MSNKKIAIASILKPVDETRMYHKIGRSLARAGYKVHIAGFKGHTESDDISLYPFFFFKRLSFQRLKASVKIFFWLVKVKPVLFIITTHELLWAGILYKLLFRKKLIYDVQENYYLNILNTHAFPPFIRSLIAYYVRMKESVTASFIDHFFLAEKGYLKEINFVKNSYTVLENKTLIIPSAKRKSRSSKTISLLFTGTLAESTGVFDCIEMAAKLKSEFENISFTIAGMCHIPEEYERLKKAIGRYEWVKVIGGNHPVPHSEIVQLINDSDAGFIYYPNLELVKNTIPTKLYEYLAYQLPILLQDYEEWLMVAQRYNAALPVQSGSFDSKEIMEKLLKQSFYTTPAGKEVLWLEEEGKLLHIVEELLKNDRPTILPAYV